jgi:hypothetical protein
VGALDLPAPFFAFADRVLGEFLPPWSRLIVWGLAAGFTSTWLYRSFSHQDRIAAVKTEAAQAQAALLAYDGDFNGALPLIGRSLRLSMRHLLLTGGPALAAGLPVLLLFVWLSNAYGYREPAAGAAVTVRIEPANTQVKWYPAAESAGHGGTWRIAWPAAGQQYRLSDAAGHLLVTLPLRAPIPEVQKFVWWNVLLGNPAGYLPAGARVRSVEVAYPAREFLHVGPEWLRGWELVCIIPAIIVSITFRVALGIH